MVTFVSAHHNTVDRAGGGGGKSINISYYAYCIALWDFVCLVALSLFCAIRVKKLRLISSLKQNLALTYEYTDGSKHRLRFKKAYDL